MRTLIDRVDALEQASATWSELECSIFVRGGRENESFTVISANGMRWTRLPDETTEAFKQRAKREAPRPTSGAVRFFCMD